MDGLNDDATGVSVGGWVHRIAQLLLCATMVMLPTLALAQQTLIEPTLALPENIRQPSTVALSVPSWQNSRPVGGISVPDAADLGGIAQRLERDGVRFEWAPRGGDSGGVLMFGDQSESQIKNLLDTLRNEQICPQCQSMPSLVPPGGLTPTMSAPQFVPPDLAAMVIPTHGVTLTSQAPALDPIQYGGGWSDSECEVRSDLSLAIRELAQAHAAGNPALGALMALQPSCEADSMVTLLAVLKAELSGVSP